MRTEIIRNALLTRCPASRTPKPSDEGETDLNEHTLSGVAANPALPGRLLDLLIARADDGILAVLADRDDLTESRIRALLARRDPGAAYALIAWGRVPRADVPRDDPYALLAAVHAGIAPPEVLAELLTDDGAAILTGDGARPPALPPPLIAGLLDEDRPGHDRETAWAAAGDPSLPVGVMERAVRDGTG